MNKVIVFIAVAIYSNSIIYAQDKQLNAKPVYDNMQLEKQRKKESKNLTYKQSAATWTQDEKPVRPLGSTGKQHPVKRMNKFSTPSTFKPEPIKAQPLMKQSASPAQPVQQVK